MDKKENPTMDVKNICIIGAGPAGLGALKVIKEYPEYKKGLWKAVAFEAREAIGGIWCVTSLSIFYPMLNLSRVPAPPTGNPPLTALYDSLTTNTATPLMAYPDFPFPPSTPLFPSAPVVLEYLRSYAAHFDLNKHIRLRTTVRSVDWDAGLSKWRVRWNATDAGPDASTERGLFDLIAVANGHYTHPHFPDTPGLHAWRDAGKASHSAWYRHPRNLGDTILIVGGGPSGVDIADEMRAVSRTIVHSTPGAQRVDLEGGAFKRRARVVEFLDVHEGRVRFEDGTTESGIDHCILATGFEHYLPFLPPSLVSKTLPTSVPPLPTTLHNSRFHLFPVARQVFPLTSAFPPSRLTFLVLPYRVIPFRFIEPQMRAVLAVFADPARLDVAHEADLLVKRYEAFKAQGLDDLAIAHAWHKFPPETCEQFDYIDDLLDFVGGAYGEPQAKVPQWVREFWLMNQVLRAEWRELEKSGEAEAWAAGVGDAEGEDEKWQQWQELMRRVIRRAEKRQTSEDKEKLTSGEGLPSGVLLEAAASYAQLPN
ncbi:hypothetical protein EIP86_011048 [Pleurotus ostreatoroseus]|nr:hypothetical protein EIP86_011048 [Pleurotus ostreatoroseus]